MMAEDKKEDQHINVTVRSAENEVLFRIKKTTPMAKLMNSYCDRQGKSPNSVRFHFDGKRIEKHNTAEELELEDGDIIEAYIEQQGGGDDDQKETHINIKVVSGETEVFFRIKKTTPLLKLMNSFCERQGKSLESVKFMFDGRPVLGENTPEFYEMEEGDTLDVMMHQVGGQ